MKCAAERNSKALVAQSSQDTRFWDAKFIKAPAIFANNDLKYECNKLRAKLYAEGQELAVTYVCAKDIPSADALRESVTKRTCNAIWTSRRKHHLAQLFNTQRENI